MNPLLEFAWERLRRHLVLFKTSTAVNWTITFWYERNFCFHSAARTSYLREAWTMSVLLLTTAVLATFWWLKSFFSKKLLFFSCEIKLVATVLASELLSFHVYRGLCKKFGCLHETETSMFLTRPS